MGTGAPIFISRAGEFDSLLSGYGGHGAFYEDLRKLAARHDAESLFARPEEQANGDIHWHDPLGADTAVPISRERPPLDAAAKGVLRSRLDSLANELPDDDTGHIVAKALTVGSPDAILSIGGRPLIAGWGTAAAGSMHSREAMQRNFERTIGPYSRLLYAPLAVVEDSTIAEPGATAAVVRGGSFWRGLGMSLPMFLFAALLLAILLIPGVLIWNWGHGRQAAALPIDRTGVERSLREQIARYESMLQGDVCALASAQSPQIVPAEPDSPDRGAPVAPGHPSGSAALESPGAAHPQGQDAQAGTADTARNGSDIGNTGPSAPAGEGDAQQTAPPSLPVNPRTAQVPPDAVPQGAAHPDNLLSLLDNATVFIRARRSSGSGFFISPKLIVTNAHVANDPFNGGIFFVTSKALGKVHKAKLVAKTPDSKPQHPDFAVLKIEGSYHSPSFLSLTKNISRLQNVIAAGFPGVIIRTDEEYRAFEQGNASAIPQLAVTRGEVSAIQTWSSGVQGIIHRASISRGNSGGPLVDECGRVVGINTFVTSAGRGDDSMFYSLASASLLTFLNSKGVVAHVSKGRCQTRSRQMHAGPGQQATPRAGHPSAESRQGIRPQSGRAEGGN